MICGRCGRELKSEASIKKGYGPGCLKKMKEKALPNLMRFLHD